MKYDKFWKKASDAMQVVDAERLRVYEICKHFRDMRGVMGKAEEAEKSLKHLSDAVIALNEALNHLEKS
jgi:hypothetical protein